MKIAQVIEGWKNHLLPEEKEKAFIEYVSNIRLAICEECSFHSKNHKSIRRDIHCTDCGCPLISKTKCLTCECPLQKWTAQPIPEDNEST